MSIADIVSVNFNEMLSDSRFTIKLTEDKHIVFFADLPEFDMVHTTPEEGEFIMDSDPVAEFNNWGEKQKKAYLIGYLDARTESDYMYDFNAMNYQQCYEQGRTHGELDGVWSDDEDDNSENI